MRGIELGSRGAGGTHNASSGKEGSASLVRKCCPSLTILVRRLANRLVRYFRPNLGFGGTSIAKKKHVRGGSTRLRCPDFTGLRESELLIHEVDDWPIFAKSTQVLAKQAGGVVNSTRSLSTNVWSDD